MVSVTLRRIVIHDAADRQYIILKEQEGKRFFPIVIGSNEAHEIQRVVEGVDVERPLTHQLAFSAIESLGSRIERVDIVALRRNTFFAQVELRGQDGGEPAILDARPSDAIALGLRARCPIRVAESVLAQAGVVPKDEGGLSGNGEAEEDPDIGPGPGPP